MRLAAVFWLGAFTMASCNANPKGPNDEVVEVFRIPKVPPKLISRGVDLCGLARMVPSGQTKLTHHYTYSGQDWILRFGKPTDEKPTL